MPQADPPSGSLLSAFWASLVPNPAAGDLPPWGHSQKSPAHTVTRAGMCWGPPVCLERTTVTVAQAMWGRNSTSVGPGPQEGQHAALGVVRGWDPAAAPPQGLAATTTRGPRAGEQGSSLCRGRSESASRARHTLRFTFLGKQCPVMSASARPVWVGAFHTVGCEVTEGVRVRHINRGTENTWSGRLVTT